MNTFKRKSLYAALAGVSVLGAAGTAQAVNVNPEGLGQVLVYPYYTVRADEGGSAFATLLSVVNTTNSAKAVKVRFLEGKNSAEVIDFNLFLSAKDVWTAGVTATPTGAKLVLGPGVPGKTDASCTLPTISPTSGVTFVNFAYAGDGGDSSLDRTREGYFEIIEMGTVLGGSTLETQVTHVGGVPPGCAALQSASDTTIRSQLAVPSGGLMGAESLINVTQGSDYTADPTVLDTFQTLQPIYFGPANPLPNLTNVFPPTSVVFNGAAGTVQTDWSGTFSSSPADAVSAVLMHNAVMNEYSLDPSIKSKTDWVITMPTKRFYVATNSTGTPAKLFQRNFNGTSCDDLNLSIFDREEQTTSTPLNFSPPPPTQTNSLCFEANVLTFTSAATAAFNNVSHVFGSTNVANLDITSTGFQNGWLQLNFPLTSAPNAHILVGGSTQVVTPTGIPTTNADATYFGLPTIGFAVQSYTNGTLNNGTLLSNYGGNWTHKYTRRIVTP